MRRETIRAEVIDTIFDIETGPLPDGELERPLRAMTAKGERVTVMRSDYVDAGTEIEFGLKCIKNSKGLDLDVLNLCLQFGEYIGLGQWRGSGGYGSFTLESFDEVVIQGG